MTSCVKYFLRTPLPQDDLSISLSIYNASVHVLFNLCIFAALGLLSVIYLSQQMSFWFLSHKQRLLSLFRAFIVGTHQYGTGGAQWLSGRVLDLRQRGCGFEPQRHHCVVSLSKNINSS